MTKSRTNLSHNNNNKYPTNGSNNINNNTNTINTQNVQNGSSNNNTNTNRTKKCVSKRLKVQFIVNNITNCKCEFE
jgi:hypothetical protein